MGSGKNGSFDKNPDWQQWAILQVGDLSADTLNTKDQLSSLLGKFIYSYLKLFRCTSTTYILQPLEGHGLWSKQEPFGPLPRKTDYEGRIAVLTRAAIRTKKLKRFWSHVDAVAQRMAGANGFIQSYGIGELPYIRQATFSIWESKEAMRQFAYKMPEHADVVRKTHVEKWYSEELFVRFKIVNVIEGPVGK